MHDVNFSISVDTYTILYFGLGLMNLKKTEYEIS